MDLATRQQLSKGGAMAVKDAGGGISASGSAVSALLGADPHNHNLNHHRQEWRRRPRSSVGGLSWSTIECSMTRTESDPCWHAKPGRNHTSGYLI